MPQQVDQTTRNSFNKGLLTEHSELNFPTEASVDELNCTLFKAGNRTKRLGLEYEGSYELSSNIYPEGALSGVYSWENVGEDADTQYAVVQIGSLIRFYLKSEAALSSEEVPTSDTDSTPYIFNMNAYNRTGGEGAQASHIDVTSINGRLVVASPQIETFYIERDTTDGSFSTHAIDFKIRDFTYLTNRTTLTEEAATPVDASRKYDTANCGWVGDNGESALSTYESNNTAYPPLSHPWYSGKASNGLFSITLWEQVYSGNTLIVNGHFILDLFTQNRGAASGIAGAESTPIDKRFSTVTSFAGRVFFAGADEKIYFSRILEDFDDIGNLYQVNDPTSEETSDLLDTDGGYISIPDANGIKKLVSFGASLLVFADNGVWRVIGVDNVFRATEYSVYRISDNGLSARKSLVQGQNGVPFWWGYTGVHTIAVTEDNGLVEENVSQDTIQTFWNNISGDSRANVFASYDGLNDVVLWFYPDDDETTENKVNNILLLDTRLGAFYPWTISDLDTDTPYVMGASFYNGKGSQEVTYNVTDSNGNQVVDSNGDNVTVNRLSGHIKSSALKLLVRDPSGSITFAEFTGTDFLDWNESNYECYAEAAYNFMGDLGRRKNSPYITVFLKTTQTGWVSNPDGTYTAVRPSSCRVSTYWDFKKTASSSKQEAYREKFTVDSTQLTEYNYPYTVITTRLKTRGRGRVMRVKFEGREGYDFNLLGWETLNARNSGY